MIFKIPKNINILCKKNILHINGYKNLNNTDKSRKGVERRKKGEGTLHQNL